MRVFNVDFMDTEESFMVASDGIDEAARALLAHPSFVRVVQKNKCDPPILASVEDYRSSTQR